MTFMKRKSEAYRVAHIMNAASRRQLRTVCGLKVPPSQFEQRESLGGWLLCPECGAIAAARLVMG